MSQTYNALYDIFPYFHFSTLIPWEKYFFLEANLEPFFEESKYLIDVWSVATILLIVSVLISQFSKRMAIRLVSNCVILSILITVLQSSYMLRIQPDHAVVSAANSIELGATIITIQFKEKTRASVIRFLDYSGIWAPPKYPKEFSISTSQDGITYKKIGNVRADSFIRLPSIENVLAIKLSAISDPKNSQWASGEISILENKFGIRIDKCTDNCALEIEDNILVKYTPPLAVGILVLGFHGGV